jgi:hypothetical protein
MMDTVKINSEIALSGIIVQLEAKQAAEGKLLKEQFQLTYDSLKPVNLIKSTFQEVVASQDLKDHLLNTSIGLTAGYLSKVLFEGSTHNPVKKLFGSALMFGITNAVAKNPEAIKSLAAGFFKMIRGQDIQKKGTVSV